jgi:prepilin-type N-terminal cleavage/methylation domain-containing protein/prepilin-type processing-associated H-X9-DG protein
MKLLRKKGFTLVEMLIVITIISVVSALSYGAVTKMIARAKAAKEMENLRQMGPLFTVYASDHNMSLPPCKGQVVQPDDTSTETHWHEALLSLLYPDTNPAEFKTTDWWNNNEPFMRNPLFKETALPRGWAPLNPGYGMNQMITENLARASTGVVPSLEELLAISTPLAAIAEPSRTPLVAPCDNFYFRYDTDAELTRFKSSTLKEFLFQGKFPILFVDGHVETVSPSEYQERELHLVPISPTP